MVGIDFIVTVVNLFWKIIASSNWDIVFFKEVKLLENLVDHERKTRFLKHIAKYEHVKLDFVHIKVVQCLIKLILSIV